MGETSYSLMKRLYPKNLMQGDTALAPPSQEKSEQKVSPLNHDREPHDDGMRGVLPAGSMQTARKIQVSFTNSRERVKKRMRELEAEMQDLRRRMATTSKEDSNDDEFEEESPFLREIQMEPLSPNFKEPRMTPYDGRMSNEEHKFTIAPGIRPGSRLWGNMSKRELDDIEDFYREQKDISASRKATESWK
uniref:Uncharacterized protein n=1 Tax=Cannabis sativa TaxID=3483 RepID=A0A803PI35_CANSA